MTRRRLLAGFLLILCVGVHSTTANATSPATYSLPIRGADVSYLPQIEDQGGVYSDHATPRDALQILKNHGANYVRLRVWHTPIDGYTDLTHTLQLAQRAKSLGLGLLLDLHYSDTWADPAHQTKPAAWAALPFNQLTTEVYSYTAQVITALKNQHTLQDMLQIGNEISSGLLWTDGRVSGAYEANWPQLAALLKAGIAGARDSLSGGEQVAIVLHIDTGGNNVASRWFFDHIVAQQVPFNLIGLSYYPWWHGTLGDLQANVNDLAARYGKPIVLAETAYPWTLDWADNTPNLVGSPDQLLVGYPASVAGQRAFLIAVQDVLRQVPDGLGRGFFYWAPEAISTAGFGSVWENVALFDFQGRALDSLAAFRGPLYLPIIWR